VKRAAATDTWKAPKSSQSLSLGTQTNSALELTRSAPPVSSDIATLRARLWRGLSLLALRAAHATVVLTCMQRATRRSGARWWGYLWSVNRSLLAGPEGHPFHPLLVPLPIGAFVSSLIFDILTRTRADGLPYLVDGAFWLIGVGLIGALMAAVFGVLDFRTIQRGTPAFATARRHLMLNAVTVVLFAIGYAWRAGDHVELDKTRWGQLSLSAVAVAFLIAAIWLGGTLTYHHGMRVAGQGDHEEGTTRRG
jgi:uncharacterized membrane protein